MRKRKEGALNLHPLLGDRKGRPVQVSLSELDNQHQFIFPIFDTSKFMKKLFLLVFICTSLHISAQNPKIHFNVLALYENGGHHIAYSKRAKFWLNKLSAEKGFSIDYIQNTDQINEGFLNKYQLFIQLDYPPYGWTEDASAAFKNYIEQGRGGWIGFHHATLLGEFDDYPTWQWFSQFMGDIVYKNYIATFVKGKVTVEDKHHPVMKGIPASFTINNEEWYNYNKSPRPNVYVLASVDEKSYRPGTDIKMGDHPVIWTNEHVKARNVYIFMYGAFARTI